MYIELLSEVALELVGAVKDFRTGGYLAIVRPEEGYLLHEAHPTDLTIIEEPQDEIALELVTLLVFAGAKYKPFKGVA